MGGVTRRRREGRRSDLVKCIDEMVLESQLPQEIVDLLLTITD